MTNQQDLIFKAKFEDDASEDIQSLDKDVENLDGSMGGLSMSAVTAGLAMFGVGVGVQQVIQGAAESHKQITATRAMIKLLPESAQQALHELAPFFNDIGDAVGKTNNEVAETAVAITTASGGIAPSIDELQFVYDLMAATGADAATAAAAVGEALRGNEEPLQTLLGDKYNFHSMNEALDKLRGTAQEAKTPLDEIAKTFKEIGEQFATTKGIMEFFFGKEGAEFLSDLTAILSGDVKSDAVSPLGGGGGIMTPDEIEREIMGSGVYGVGAAGAGAMATGNNPVSVGITINGDIDSAQRASVIMRQVELQIRNIYRGGINTIVDSRMFPS